MPKKSDRRDVIRQIERSGRKGALVGDQIEPCGDVEQIETIGLRRQIDGCGEPIQASEHRRHRKSTVSSSGGSGKQRSDS